MDWPAGLGLIMGIIATADLAYKYGSALFKKIHLRPRAGKVTHSQKIVIKINWEF